MITAFIKTIYKIFVCHFLGDYVLQTDFLANTKGKNWWHLVAHCFLYTAPFAVVFGLDWRIIFLFATHIVIDAMKARYKKIDYFTDQILHMLINCIYIFN